MPADEIRRRSRWMIRALEWNDPKARYPNLWHEGMPVQIMAFDTIAMRLRLGDLIAVYHPASQKHAKRGGKFLGISRVTGLRKAHAPDFSWIDLETAHRFSRPLDLGAAPRRVFLCCDPGWPGQDTELFEKVFRVAVSEGWRPADTEQAEGAPKPETASRMEIPAVEAVIAAPAPAEETAAVPEEAPQEPDGATDEEAPAAPVIPAAAESPAEPPAEPEAHVVEEAVPAGRLFAGVDYSGDMRDPRDGTWLALGVVEKDRFRIVRLEATGRQGLQGYLRDPDRALMNAEAIGFTFPFAVPETFAEKVLEGPYPEEGWWGLARKFERMNYPDYLVQLQDFREAHGDAMRLTDEKAGALSPLHRSGPDRGTMMYHGIRMIAEERSRYVVRPFESAQGRLLLEVYPGALIQKLGVDPEVGSVDRVAAVLQAVARLEHLPVLLEEKHLARCRGRLDALDAVLAARCAAAAVLSGEAERSAEELAPDAADRVRREGWIYGVEV